MLDLFTLPKSFEFLRLRSLATIVTICLLASVLALSVAHVIAQENIKPSANPPDAQDSVRGVTGYWIDVPAELTSASNSSTSNSSDPGPSADRLLARFNRLADATRPGERTTVLLRLKASESDGNTAFEDALKLARALGQPELRTLKIVVWIDGELDGHRQLIALAAEQLLVSGDGSLGSVQRSSVDIDETIELTYSAIARRRGLVPPSVVDVMLDRDGELAMVSTVNGAQVLASGDELETLRSSGQVLREEVWKEPGATLRLSAQRLRDARVVAGVVDSLDETADLLDVAELVASDAAADLDAPRGALLEISGAISRNRSRRWQSNLAASLESGDVNTWLVDIDSSGGNIDTSMSLAATFALPQPPLQTTAGFISREARGDSAIIALACRPLMMSPDSKIGGPGSQVVSHDDLRRHGELIEQIAVATKRPVALLRGILNPDIEVYRYTDRKTGRLRYASPAEVELEQADGDEQVVEDPASERWERGERIELAQGLTPSQAIALGLAETEVTSLAEAASKAGLEGVPPEVVDRPIVRFVERIGRSNGLMFVLLMIGFFTLSAEAGAPGIGVPGFISMLCFALYFWMKFLAGTAEWLELVAVALGLVFIAIEIFVVPGFGVFGVGGLALVVLGVVLMSQTFVIPQNSYQIEVLTRGIWVALGSLIGLAAGFVMIRSYMPHVPLLNQLVMESGDVETIDRQERVADYSYLAGQVGVATTVLRPSGKARFGDTIVAVVSDGTPLDPGASIRVREVHGNRIVVEAIES